MPPMGPGQSPGAGAQVLNFRDFIGFKVCFPRVHFYKHYNISVVLKGVK
jgi:hypothetical protein